MEKHRYISAEDAFRLADRHALAGIPFFIAVDFELDRALFIPLDNVPASIHFQCGDTICNPLQSCGYPVQIKAVPVPYSRFAAGYENIIREIKAGNSYLVNYTAASRLTTGASLSHIYASASAKYKLLVDDEFTVFSPESFITISGSTISTFPMKGTIDASQPNAEAIILADAKEQAEHATIVDLLRNDLSKVSNDVRVRRYRYTETVRSACASLLQVSSEISGSLLPEYDGRIGSILRELLPAGSVSGAPKNRTLEIIRNAEDGPRGFYCGIMGVYDGSSFSSGVLIRFIEQAASGLVYRSGGGITAMSDISREYEELIQKIYVPTP